LLKRLNFGGENFVTADAFCRTIFRHIVKKLFNFKILFLLHVMRVTTKSKADFDFEIILEFAGHFAVGPSVGRGFAGQARSLAVKWTGRFLAACTAGHVASRPAPNTTLLQ
ncbi:hypothetical protein BpHYR1_023173, partial [Brachionus plicatilis]